MNDDANFLLDIVDNVPMFRTLSDGVWSDQRPAVYLLMWSEAGGAEMFAPAETIDEVRQLVSIFHDNYRHELWTWCPDIGKFRFTADVSIHSQSKVSR